jgi:hypothetical protein
LHDHLLRKAVGHLEWGCTMTKFETDLDAGVAAGEATGTHRNAGKAALQLDLFTGEWQDKPPKRGTGSHVRLKRFEDEKPAVAGMASFADEGPMGKYCKDCGYFGEIAVQRTADAIEKNPAGCVFWAQRMGHAAPTTRRDIRFCAACKHFVAADEAVRCFIVDQAGVVYGIDHLPADLRRWQPRLDDNRIAFPAAVLSAETN